MMEELNLNDHEKKTLVDLMLKQDVKIHSKIWGVDGLEEVAGSVYGIYPGVLIEFLKDGENDYRHFCGPVHGIAMITDNDGKKLYYKNMKVLDIGKTGFGRDKSLKEEVLKAGVFFMDYERFPKEIYF
jgi:hypothetical protein